jgi:hypothetical protein
MEEIILHAKQGPPVSKLVGHHIVTTKALTSASIVETYKKPPSRRITGKQKMSQYAAKRELMEAVRIAKKQTKREGKKTLRKVVNDLHIQANGHTVAMKASLRAQINAAADKLMEQLDENGIEATQQQAMGKILGLLIANDIVK